MACSSIFSSLIMHIHNNEGGKTLAIQKEYGYSQYDYRKRSETEALERELL